MFAGSFFIFLARQRPSERSLRCGIANFSSIFNMFRNGLVGFGGFVHWFPSSHGISLHSPFQTSVS